MDRIRAVPFEVATLRVFRCAKKSLVDQCGIDKGETSSTVSILNDRNEKMRERGEHKE